MSIARRLESHWQERGAVALLLAPLSLLYCVAARLRRTRLEGRRISLPVPVVVVGNITVGGTGKTPLVIWLCRHLRAHGLAPGVVSRGYGGRRDDGPCEVTADSDPRAVGDEPLLIARRAECPVVVDRDRRRAAAALLARHRCDVIVSDDGLQHYRLPRDVEIAVVDGERRLGNGLCIPAGPLREPPARLREVDFVVTNGEPEAGEYGMRLVAGRVVNLADPGREEELESFRCDEGVHAVAGIGNPQRFFDLLAARGLPAERHPFPDHHPFTAADLDFGDDRPVLMTEKDAVKCREFARPHHWYLPVVAEPDAACAAGLLAAVQEIKRKTT